MSEIRSYDYVNQPYARVRDALSKDAEALFQAATKAASSRARSVASELRVDIGGIAIEADVRISVRKIEETHSDVLSAPMTTLHVEWEAATMPQLFPFMKAEISLYPLTSTETQIDFLGHYDPPLGAVGKAINAIAGHRIAEASVHRFVNDVAEHLRRTLSGHPEWS